MFSLVSLRAELQESKRRKIERKIGALRGKYSVLQLSSLQVPDKD